MTTYDKRDIRAADMLALVLVGLGVILLFFTAILVFDKGVETRPARTATEAAETKTAGAKGSGTEPAGTEPAGTEPAVIKASLAKPRPWRTDPSLGMGIAAAVSLLLGLALHLKVKQLVRNKGREREDYAGVPE